MNNAAILVGNTQYDSLNEIRCCHDDLLAMKELLEATERYSDIEVIENTNADNLKARMRAAIDRQSSVRELFFYFTGHGCQQDYEFYYCATEFDSSRPNATGISTNELHELLSLSKPTVLVKVIDACNSGTVLVKSGQGFMLDDEPRFRHLIQISSCLDSQNSLAGQPLSVFTEKFRDSALRKEEGVVHYTDIVSTLRDEFINNQEQTPFFVTQGTAREHFVEDAKRLDALRERILLQRQGSPSSESNGGLIPVTASTLPELLAAAENRVATPEKISSFTDSLFDALRGNLSIDEFSELFDSDLAENPDFSEPSAEKYIVDVLRNQTRSDKFVTAERKREPNSMWGIWIGGYRETYDLRLNCHMKRAQLKFTLTPKYRSLKMFTLVVTCAPSLDLCYVFEVIAQHSLEDFGRYDEEGEEVARRWYKFRWDENADDVVRKAVTKLKEVVRGYLERTQHRLIDG